MQANGNSTTFRPRTDDRLLTELLSGFIAFPAVLIAHDLKLFAILGEKPRNASEISECLNVPQKPTETLLTACCSLGLLQPDGDKYRLTEFSEDYLLENSPTSLAGYLKFFTANYNALGSLENLKSSLLSNAPQMHGDWTRSHREQAEFARTFAYAMHGASVGPAQAWPDHVDLSEHHLLLDIGGGSGAHAIAAAARWPDLNVVVFDLDPVCDVAKEWIRTASMEDRVSTRAGDMWKDDFPESDVHLYSQIYHDYPPKNCRFLTQKSFESLKSGGFIILHEMLLDDDKTGPRATATINIATLVGTGGQQFSGKELVTMLTDAGFVNVEVKPTFGYWSIVTGSKP